MGFVVGESLKLAVLWWRRDRELRAVGFKASQRFEGMRGGVVRGWCWCEDDRSGACTNVLVLVVVDVSECFFWLFRVVIVTTEGGSSSSTCSAAGSIRRCRHDSSRGGGIVVVVVVDCSSTLVLETESMQSGTRYSFSPTVAAAAASPITALSSDTGERRCLAAGSR